MPLRCLLLSTRSVTPLGRGSLSVISTCLSARVSLAAQKFDSLHVHDQLAARLALRREKPVEPHAGPDRRGGEQLALRSPMRLQPISQLHLRASPPASLCSDSWCSRNFSDRDAGRVCAERIALDDHAGHRTRSSAVDAQPIRCPVTRRPGRLRGRGRASAGASARALGRLCRLTAHSPRHREITERAFSSFIIGEARRHRVLHLARSGGAAPRR